MAINFGNKGLRSALRDVAQSLTSALDIRHVPSFPDKNSSISARDQIAAGRAAAETMEEFHALNQMGHLGVRAIPPEALALAEKAYMDGLRQRGGQAAVDAELRRRKDYAEVVSRNDEFMAAATPDTAFSAKATPDMMARSVVLVVDNDSDFLPKPPIA